MNKTLIRTLAIFIGLILLTGVTMAFGKSLVLFSPFYGTVVDGRGEPVAGAQVVRNWVWGWNDSSGSDTTATDDSGKFDFPVVRGNSFFGSLLPHEPDVKQRITVSGPNGDVEVWFASKKSYDLNSEMDGRPVRVKCNIDQEPSDEGLYWGTCVEDR